MDPLSVRMVRAALIWLAIGFVLGALMLVDGMIAGRWRLWFSPTHGHILFVGWFLQFAVGIAYWLLPRKRSDEKPLGYSDRWALVAFLSLNLGLAARVIVEPTERMGYTFVGTDAMLVLSAILQVTAIGIVVTQLWGRVIPRPPKRARTTETNR